MDKKDIKQVMEWDQQEPATSIALETESFSIHSKKDILQREKAKVWFSRNFPACSFQSQTDEKYEESSENNHSALTIYQQKSVATYSKTEKVDDPESFNAPEIPLAETMSDDNPPCDVDYRTISDNEGLLIGMSDEYAKEEETKIQRPDTFSGMLASIEMALSNMLAEKTELQHPIENFSSIETSSVGVMAEPTISDLKKQRDIDAEIAAELATLSEEELAEIAGFDLSLLRKDDESDKETKSIQQDLDTELDKEVLTEKVALDLLYLVEDASETDEIKAELPADIMVSSEFNENEEKTVENITNAEARSFISEFETGLQEEVPLVIEGQSAIETEEVMSVSSDTSESINESNVSFEESSLLQGNVTTEFVSQDSDFQKNVEDTYIEVLPREEIATKETLIVPQDESKTLDDAVTDLFRQEQFDDATNEDKTGLSNSDDEILDLNVFYEESAKKKTKIVTQLSDDTFLDDNDLPVERFDFAIETETSDKDINLEVSTSLTEEVEKTEASNQIDPILEILPVLSTIPEENELSKMDEQVESTIKLDPENALSDGILLAEGESSPDFDVPVVPVLNETMEKAKMSIPEEDIFREKMLSHQRNKMAFAEYKVAVAYARKNTEKADREMIRWYTRAAENGHAVSQFNLGNIYYAGRGVQQDYKMAADWYEMAARQGVARAQDNLGLMYLYGRGRFVDTELAVYWFHQAALQGYAPAQYKLAMHLETGVGIEADLQEAMYWYQRAESQGDINAKKAISRIEGNYDR